MIKEILKKIIKKTKFSFVHFCGLEKCPKSIMPSGILYHKRLSYIIVLNLYFTISSWGHRNVYQVNRILNELMSYYVTTRNHL